MTTPPKYLPRVCTCEPSVNGAWLVAVREGAGLNRPAMAARLRVSPWTLKDMERNRRPCWLWVQRAYEQLAAGAR